MPVGNWGGHRTSPRRIAIDAEVACGRGLDPFNLEPAFEEPVLNLPLALKLRHLHELTHQVASRDLVPLVVLHPVATRPHDVASGRIEEGAIGGVRSTRTTPGDPGRVIRMTEA